MMTDIEFKKITHHALNLLYPGVAKLENMFAVFTNQVIMLLVGKAFFKAGEVFPELMPGNQVGILKEFNSIVKRGTAYLVSF